MYLAIFENANRTQSLTDLELAESIFYDIHWYEFFFFFFFFFLTKTVFLWLGLTSIRASLI